MTKTYRVLAPRPAAILFAAWEYGIRRAAEIVNDLPADERGWVDFACAPCHGAAQRSRRYADGLAARIRQAVAYQEGRMKRHLTGGIVEVTA